MTREVVHQGVGRWREIDQEHSTLVAPGVVDEDKALLTELTSPGLPVIRAHSADGRVVDRQIGEVYAARIEELVSRLVAGGAAS